MLRQLANQPLMSRFSLSRIEPRTGCARRKNIIANESRNLIHFAWAFHFDRFRPFGRLKWRFQRRLHRRAQWIINKQTIFRWHSEWLNFYELSLDSNTFIRVLSENNRNMNPPSDVCEFSRKYDWITLCPYCPRCLDEVIWILISSYCPNTDQLCVGISRVERSGKKCHLITFQSVNYAIEMCHWAIFSKMFLNSSHGEQWKKAHASMKKASTSFTLSFIVWRRSAILMVIYDSKSFAKKSNSCFVVHVKE